MNPGGSADPAADFYRQCRLEDQQGFYDRRADEYETANTQLSRLSTALLLAAVAAGLLGIPQWLISRTAWGIVAAVCSALVAAIAGWGTLIGFQQNASLYRGAAAALREASAGASVIRRPGPRRSSGPRRSCCPRTVSGAASSPATPTARSRLGRRERDMIRPGPAPAPGNDIDAPSMS